MAINSFEVLDILRNHAEVGDVSISEITAVTNGAGTCYTVTMQAVETLALFTQNTPIEEYPS